MAQSVDLVVLAQMLLKPTARRSRWLQAFTPGGLPNLADITNFKAGGIWRDGGSARPKADPKLTAEHHQLQIERHNNHLHEIKHNIDQFTKQHGTGPLDDKQQNEIDRLNHRQVFHNNMVAHHTQKLKALKVTPNHTNVFNSPKTTNTTTNITNPKPVSPSGQPAVTPTGAPKAAAPATPLGSKHYELGLPEQQRHAMATPRPITPRPTVPRPMAPRPVARPPQMAPRPRPQPAMMASTRTARV